MNNKNYLKIYLFRYINLKFDEIISLNKKILVKKSDNK